MDALVCPSFSSVAKDGDIDGVFGAELCVVLHIDEFSDSCVEVW